MHPAAKAGVDAHDGRDVKESLGAPGCKHQSEGWKRAVRRWWRVGQILHLAATRQIVHDRTGRTSNSSLFSISTNSGYGNILFCITIPDKREACHGWMARLDSKIPVPRRSRSPRHLNNQSTYLAFSQSFSKPGPQFFFRKAGNDPLQNNPAARISFSSCVALEAARGYPLAK